MAMNKTILGALMKANVDALTVEQIQGRTAIFEALADAVITHLTAAATFAGFIVVGTSATGGPVTGTATGAPGSIT